MRHARSRARRGVRTQARSVVALCLLAAGPAGATQAETAAAAAAGATTQPPILIEPTAYDGAAALGLALRRLGTSKRVLMIAAHPDDENTAVLAELALGQGADVAYLSLTRGEGGQNGIGPELDEGLGLIRSEELLAARRLDGARQFFTRAYDFGFSRTADETFRHWPRDTVLADVVEVIRRFRPDIVLSVFAGSPADGHGHHQAAGILARDAFEAAADPARFAAQGARGLAPHRPAVLYQTLWRAIERPPYTLETGTFDPLLGRSRFQIAMASRSRHRSQDMGAAEPPGPQRTGLVVLAGDAPPPGGSLFARVDTTLAQRARRHGVDAATLAVLERYEAAVVEARRRYSAFDPHPLVETLLEARRLLAPLGRTLAADLAFHHTAEMRDLDDALRRAAGLVLDATADTERVVPGRPFTLALRLWNGGAGPVRVARLAPALPHGWTTDAVDATGAAMLAPGELLTRRFRVTAPPDAEPTQPYFVREGRDGALYRWPADGGVRTLPFEPAAIRGAVDASLAGAGLSFEVEATYVEVDRAYGEVRRPVLVVPAIALDVEPRILVVPAGAAARADGDGGTGTDATPVVRVRLRHHAPDATRGRLLVHVPPGWSAEPAAVDVVFAGPGEQRSIDVRLAAGPVAAGSAGSVRFEFETADGRRYANGERIIAYPHTAPRALYQSAVTRVHVMDVRIADGLRVGYLEGAGDDGARALRQLGAAVEPIDTDLLARGDLSHFDAIVLGIRAFEVRSDVHAYNDRLLAFARAGGTVVVQYNKYEYPDGGFPPYRLTMARPHGRVTDEDAVVRLLEPDHPLLAWPNRIGDADFSGWVQERGLYFADTWDDRWTPLLVMADAGQPPQRGSLLVARVGDGLYIYTGLALFRQWPEGVAGAYRLLANLVSAGRADGDSAIREPLDR